MNHASRLAITGSIRPARRRHRYGQAVALLEWLAPRAEAFIAGLVLSGALIGIFAI